MKSRLILSIILSLATAFGLTSCGTSRSASAANAEMRELARAGLRLGFDIDEDDNWPLMIEASKWLGTPYRLGGNTRRGVDCSGLSCALYAKVFRVKLHRNSREQYEQDCRSVGRGHLESGDLLFFAPNGKKKSINHVGVFLKGDRFVHASGSRGVRVSSLDEPYFQRTLAACGRVKRR